jgi:hypothetical protein
MSNEAIFGIIFCACVIIACVICFSECCSEIDFINNQNIEIEIENEIEDIEANITEKKAPKQNLTLMHPDQINPIL